MSIIHRRLLIFNLSKNINIHALKIVFSILKIFWIKYPNVIVELNTKFIIKVKISTRKSIFRIINLF